MGLENPQILPQSDQLSISNLSQDVKDRLARIYEIYGDDPSKWDWEEEIKPRCRAIWRGTGFGMMEVVAAIKLGNLKCPLLEREGKFPVSTSVRSPHPADNIIGPIAAATFPHKCKACNLAAESYDFQKDWGRTGEVALEEG